MSIPNPQDTTAAAYRELRSLAESLLDAKTARDRRRVAAAITQFLYSHCAICGDILLRQARLAPGDGWCLVCEALLIPPPPTLPSSTDDEVPF